MGGLSCKLYHQQLPVCNSWRSERGKCFRCGRGSNSVYELFFFLFLKQKRLWFEKPKLIKKKTLASCKNC